MRIEPALNVVVYPEPGPGGDVEQQSRDFLQRKNVSVTGGDLGYVVLRRADFDRIWVGVDRGDAVATAAAVLRHLGPHAAQFIGRSADFVYGWVGDDDPQEGRALRLQVIPRPHVIASRRGGVELEWVGLH